MENNSKRKKRVLFLLLMIIVSTAAFFALPAAAGPMPPPPCPMPPSSSSNTPSDDSVTKTGGVGDIVMSKSPTLYRLECGTGEAIQRDLNCGAFDMVEISVPGEQGYDNGNLVEYGHEKELFVVATTELDEGKSKRLQIKESDWIEWTKKALEGLKEKKEQNIQEFSQIIIKGILGLKGSYTADFLLSLDEDTRAKFFAIDHGIEEFAKPEKEANESEEAEFMDKYDITPEQFHALYCLEKEKQKLEQQISDDEKIIGEYERTHKKRHSYTLVD